MSRFHNYAVILLLLISAPLASWAAPEDYRFELAGQPEKTGAGTLVKVRLIAVAGGTPVTGAEFSGTRLDMGPDGMAAMTAPVKALPASAPGVYLFEAQPSMAGNWALSFSAKIAGEAEPVSGAVTVTVAK